MERMVKNISFSFLLFSASFCLRFLALMQTTYANGWDGYFYINQVRSFLEEGKMDVPDASLIYPILVLAQVITNNYILSFKIVACLLAASFTVSLFLLALKWSDNRKIPLVLASFSLFSPHLTYFAAQYPKNLLGIVLFLWLLSAVDSKIKFLPLLLLIVNFFGHRVTAVLSFLFLMLQYVFKKLTRHVLNIVLLFLSLFLAAGFLLPGIINLFDAERFQGIFTAQPHFAPFSFVKTFGTGLLSIYWLTEIILVCILFASAVAYAAVQIYRKQIDNRLITLLIILFLLIFPFFQWSMDGPAFRFLLIFILICPILLIFMTRSINNNYVFSILCALPLLASTFSYSSYCPEKHDPPYGVYNIISKQITSKVNASSCELIIAHKSLAEYFVYATGIDAMSWIPEYDIDSEKLWRVAAEVKDIQFSYYLPPEDLKFVYRLTPSYCFIREDVWRKFIANVTHDHNEELLNDLATWRNPAKVRPYFMLKNKR